jgi:uncharacterized protein
MAKILISGGSGLVGKAVTRELLSRGHEVAWLSRQGGKRGAVKTFRWDPDANFIDPSAFDGVEHLIHLAGASLIGRRWTKKYKERIVASRVHSAELLYRQVIVNGVKLKSFTGASAVGYYGAMVSDRLFREEDRAGADFLARVCVAWEHSYAPFRTAGIRTVIVRTAIVLDPRGGALRKMLPVFRAGLGAAVAPGSQAFPWIHIHDLAAFYSDSCFSGELGGAYNLAAPEQVTNEQFSRTLAQQLKRPMWLPKVPGFALRLALGEAATTLTTGVHADCGKLMSAGFVFGHPRLHSALAHLLRAPSGSL